MAELRSGLAELTALARTRLVATAGDGVGPGSASDRAFDAAFERLVDTANQAGLQLQSMADVEADRVQLVEGSVLLLGVVLTAALLLVLAIYESRLRRALFDNERQGWLTQGESLVETGLRGEATVEGLLNDALNLVARYTGAAVGSAHAALEGERLHRMAGFALPPGNPVPADLAFGETIVGQAARDRQPLVLTDLPEQYLTVTSGAQRHAPSQLVVVPVTHEDRVRAVLELGYASPPHPETVALVERVARNLGIALHAAETRAELKAILLRTQAQAEQLEQQQRELRATNEALDGQAKLLRASEAELRAQQEELRAMNESLAERSRNLAAAGEELGRQNTELARVGRELEAERSKLLLAGRYKSEFLANMSHELRTPLNTIGLLAGLLAENREGRLTSDQLSSVRTIIEASKDLLALIEDVLDHSKIEAGQVRLRWELVSVTDLVSRVAAHFHAAAERKGLTFATEVRPGVPGDLWTDPVRLEQILRNLLSNAVKFTERGTVTLTISTAQVDAAPGQRALRFAVKDTGCGIARDQQERIFEAFQQVDGSASRAQGGTGLGLSISRRLAGLLGGKLVVSSAPGEGSAFTLEIPASPAAAVDGAESGEPTATPRPPPCGAPPAPTDAATGSPEPSALPSSGHGDGPSIAPGEGLRPSQAQGAVLIVEDDPATRATVRAVAALRDVEVLEARTGEEALALLRSQPVCCVILDLGLPGMSGFEVLATMQAEPALARVPVLVHTARELSAADCARLEGPGHTVVLKGPRSGERLADELASVLRGIGEGQPVGARSLRAGSPGGDVPFTGRRVLLVDDDMRTAFALRKVLQSRGLEVTLAENGVKALGKLSEGLAVDAVLMDVMMPIMDGLEATRRIRATGRWPRLPIVALTAKAMPDDREACLRAGADECLTKPVDVERLFGLLRTWLS